MLSSNGCAFREKLGFMFKIQEKAKPETAVWLVKKDTLISNDGSGDLSFTTNKPEVSKIKIQIEDNHIYLVDLTFNFPIFLNEKMVPAGSKLSLKHADQFRLGDITYEIINPKLVAASYSEKSTYVKNEEPQWNLQAVGNWLDGQTFTLGNRTVIGRDNTCDITIPGTHLSRRHAEFLVAGHSLFLRDLDSANGSFVNGKRIQETQLKNGDVIKLDVLSFRIIAPANTSATRTAIRDAINPSSNGHTITETNSQRNWVTKPTSIGNRTDDSIDLILAKHQRSKRILLSVFGSILAITAISLIYIFALR